MKLLTFVLVQNFLPGLTLTQQCVDFSPLKITLRLRKKQLFAIGLEVGKLPNQEFLATQTEQRLAFVS